MTIMTDKKKTILEAVEKLTDTYRKEDLFLANDRKHLPNKKEIINFIKDMRSIIFPGYFSVDSSASVFPEHYVAYRLNDLYDCLQEQIEIAFLYQGDEEQKAKEHAEQITERFFANVPEIQRMLLTDLQAGFDGDPAAKSKEEIIFSYPGFYAIYVYRLAHVLYLENVPFIPRIMSEYAHGYTGIDINPGATIGEYFFIDHGTGVVIGETTEIGKNVKLYQGVTLGGNGKETGKRHPTLKDNVMVSAGAKIIGSFTIGENSKIGAGSVVIEEVPPHCTVVGVPGHIVKQNDVRIPRKSMDHIHLPDPIFEDIKVLQQENTELTNRVLELEGELRHMRKKERTPAGDYSAFDPCARAGGRAASD